MNNIDVFKSFWDVYEIAFKEIWNRDLDNESLEELIMETKDIFIKNSVIITRKKFEKIELSEVDRLVEEFFKS